MSCKMAMYQLLFLITLLLFCTLSWAEVDLICFKAIPGNNRVILKWKTASETNNYSFNIYRNATRIASVQGAGNSATEITYTYIDNVANGFTRSYQISSVDSNGVETMEDVVVTVTPSDECASWNQFYLGPVDPNPFKSNTAIYYQSPESTHVLLEVHNVIGKKITTLVNGVVPADYHMINWDASELKSGVYFCRMRAGSFDEMIELWLVKELDIGLSLRYIPSDFVLFQNYPNPFNSDTQFNYQIAKKSRVTLKVYNIMGQEISTLVDDNLEAGYYIATWNGHNYHGRKVSAGIYFCTLKAGEFSQTRKMVLLR